MITPETAFKLGIVHNRYYAAANDNREFLGIVPDEIAVHFVRQPQIVTVAILVGVCSRVHQPTNWIGSVGDVLPEEADSFIEECMEFIRTNGSYIKMIDMGELK